MKKTFYKDCGAYIPKKIKTKTGGKSHQLKKLFFNDLYFPIVKTNQNQNYASNNPT